MSFEMDTSWKRNTEETSLWNYTWKYSTYTHLGGRGTQIFNMHFKLHIKCKELLDLGDREDFLATSIIFTRTKAGLSSWSWCWANPCLEKPAGPSWGQGHTHHPSAGAGQVWARPAPGKEASRAFQLQPRVLHAACSRWTTEGEKTETFCV